MDMNSEILSLKKEILTLKEDLNQREQYVRNWSVRINNLTVPRESLKRLKTVGACMLEAYTRIIKPVLMKAIPDVQDPEWGPVTVPPLHQLLENAHFLGKANRCKESNVLLPRTVIVRFRSRYWRNLFLMNKRKHIPSPTEQEKNLKIDNFYVAPDLTKMNHAYLLKLKSDPEVKAAWTLDSKFVFVLRSSPDKKHYIKNTLIPVQEVIKSALSIQQDPVPPTPTTSVRSTTPTPTPTPTYSQMGARPKTRASAQPQKCAFKAGSRKSAKKSKKKQNMSRGNESIIESHDEVMNKTTDLLNNIHLQQLPTDKDLQRNLFQEINFK